jgi:hypothetical protein
VTSVFSLISATENTEEKIFPAQEGPANWCYRLGQITRKHFAKGLKL